MVVIILPDIPKLIITSIGHAGTFILMGFVVAYLSLRFSHERDIHNLLSEIVVSSSSAIIGKTLDGIITEWNKSAQQLYGYTGQEVVGKSSNILIPPERKGELESILDKMRQGKSIDNFETERMTKNGERIQVVLYISPVRNDEGAVIGVSTIAYDISNRKKLEQLRAEACKEAELERGRLQTQLIHEKEELLKFLKAIQSMDDSVILTDHLGNIDYMNLAAEKLLGYPLLEIKGMHISEFKVPGTGFAIDKGAFLSDPYRVWVGKLVLKNKYGVKIPTSLKSTPVMKRKVPISRTFVLREER
ncbi:MAG: PAS domain S-box protein [Methanoregula sp.]|nr:MAG: PAS domain S-box protein [Methanoregula sp.]